MNKKTKNRATLTNQAAKRYLISHGSHWYLCGILLAPAILYISKYLAIQEFSAHTNNSIHMNTIVRMIAFMNTIVRKKSYSSVGGKYYASYEKKSEYYSSYGKIYEYYSSDG